MVILFLPKYIIYVQSINTVMCHYCDTWLTPYVEVLLYKYVCKFKEVIRLKHLLFSVKGGSHNSFSSNLCWIGLFIGLNAVGFQLICLRPLAWKNVEIIRPIPVKQWLVLETGYLLLSLGITVCIVTQRCYFMLPQLRALFDLVRNAHSGPLLWKKEARSLHVNRINV